MKNSHPNRVAHSVSQSSAHAELHAEGNEVSKATFVLIAGNKIPEIHIQLYFFARRPSSHILHDQPAIWLD